MKRRALALLASLLLLSAMPGSTLAAYSIVDQKMEELEKVNGKAEFTAGDYFDYLPMTDGSLGLVIADVPGQGHQLRKRRDERKRKMLLAASTREGEEGALLAAWAALPLPRPPSFCTSRVPASTIVRPL